MPAFVVSLRRGRKLTIQADEVRASDDGFVQLLAAAPGAAARVVAVFDRGDVASVVAREHLLADEAGDPVPYSVGGVDPIPF